MFQTPNSFSTTLPVVSASYLSDTIPLQSSELIADSDVDLFRPQRHVPDSAPFSRRQLLPEPDVTPPSQVLKIDENKLQQELKEAIDANAVLRQQMEQERQERDRTISYLQLQVKQAALKTKQSEDTVNKLKQKLDSNLNLAEKRKNDAKSFLERFQKSRSATTITKTLSRSDVEFLIEALEEERREKDERIESMENEIRELSSSLTHAANFEITGSDNIERRREKLLDELENTKKDLINSEKKFKELERVYNEQNKEIRALNDLIEGQKREHSLMIETLSAELAGRPTIKEFKDLQSRVERSEKELKNSLTEQLISTHSKPTATGTTRHQIRIDKTAHNLGVDKVLRRESRENLELFCKELCTLLNSENLTEAQNTINIMIEVVDKASRMEHFLENVFQILTSKTSCLPTPVSVIKSIHTTFKNLEGCKFKLNGISNYLRSKGVEVSDLTLLDQLENYCENLESNVCDSELKDFSDFVSEFKGLFQVTEDTALIPCLNNLYIKYTELNNFVKNLKENLGISAASTLLEIESKIVRLLSLTQNIEIKSDELISGSNSKEFEKLGRDISRIMSCSTSEVFPKLQRILITMKEFEVLVEDYTCILTQVSQLLNVSQFDDVIPVIKRMIEG
ncbi:hypothetical protein RCL1_003392 [Eukaryota sp. TZLM3-RCL]